MKLFSTEIVVLLAALASASAFTTSPTFLTPNVASDLRRTEVVVHMAGFGGGGGMGGSKKGKKGSKKKSGGGGGPAPLKPKAQWDRYVNLKKSTGVSVGVRVANDGQEEKGEWSEVGRVKTEGDISTEVAVVMQRGLIAEHAKRLFPLQFLPKDKVEWASLDGEEWTLIDKNEFKGEPGMEKKIGFQGKPDVGTGFYCHYQDGKLVDRYDEGKTLSK